MLFCDGFLPLPLKLAVLFSCPRLLSSCAPGDTQPYIFYASVDLTPRGRNYYGPNLTDERTLGYLLCLCLLVASQQFLSSAQWMCSINGCFLWPLDSTSWNLPSPYPSPAPYEVIPWLFLAAVICDWSHVRHLKSTVFTPTALPPSFYPSHTSTDHRWLFCLCTYELWQGFISLSILSSALLASVILAGPNWDIAGLFTVAWAFLVPKSQLKSKKEEDG